MNPALRFLTNGAWAIEPGVFEHLASLVENHANGIRVLPEKVAQVVAARSLFDDEEGGSEAEMEVVGRVAVIPVRGVIARYANQINGACQDSGRSAESLQSDIAKALADQRVTTIVLRIDSPGGTVAGTAETAEAIRASGKKVIAFVDGLAASAAYWLASQADEIIGSSPTALAGSIGVITAAVDASRAQEARGYKVHVVRSVAMKAPGTMNEALSADQLASLQRMIADLHGAFATAVQAGRGFDDAQLAAATTGEVFTADKAKALGLIDGIESFGSLMGRLNKGLAIAPRSITNRATIAQKGQSAMDKLQLKALLAAYPQHASLINSLDDDGKSEAEVRSAIADANHKATGERIVALEKAVADAGVALKAEQDAHAATKQAAAALQAKHDALAALGKGAAKDPGSDDTDASQGKTLSQAEYDAAKSDPARAQSIAKQIASGALRIV